MDQTIDIILRVAIVPIGAMAWWGLQYIISGQDEIRKHLREIGEKISEIKSRVGQTETRVESHEHVADDRFHAYDADIQRIWAAIERMRETIRGDERKQ
jgi:hypothetical protein